MAGLAPSGDSGEDLFPAFPTFWKPPVFHGRKGGKTIASVVPPPTSSLDLPASSYRDLCDDIRDTWIIWDKLPSQDP